MRAVLSGRRPRMSARARARDGVDNWNYVKKAVVRKDERGRRLKKRARCRHVTDIIDDREKDPLDRRRN